MCLVKLVLCVPVYMTITRAGRRVDGALALLEAAWGNLGGI